MEIKKEIEWGGRPLSISTGKLAKHATGSVVVSYGNTTVLCTVVSSKKKNEGSDFFPLTVNYQEKAFAGGKIPGGFNKREGKPSDRETLISRLIDRPLRPLFHPNFKNETQIICTVLSYDPECDSDIPSIIGASAALTISGIPFMGPVAAAKIGYDGKEFVLNPAFVASDDFCGSLDLVVAGTKEGILMVESEANEFSEEFIIKALEFGHNAYKPVIDMIISIAEDAAKDPWEISEDHHKKEFLRTFFKSDEIQAHISDAYSEKVKLERYAKVDSLYEYIVKKLQEIDQNIPEYVINDVFHECCSVHVRDKILSTGLRIDGRSNEQVRQISTEIGVLPKVHGSAIFNRGETQALGVCTLGTIDDEQFVDSLAGTYKERFLLHYNFPSYSVGETGRMGAPGRREIGHGRLAFRAIRPMLPDRSDFPYSIRVVSEILGCNGSSSMATICAASLSMMDAGVPIKKPVAGIAMGLIHDGDNDVILSDIMADEDHLGDMDFKVAGTEDGITAFQMDIKITSLSFDVLEKALQQAKIGRKYILSKMSKSISTPNSQVNENAPRIKVINIPKDKIRDVIGAGGKVIKEIIELTKAKLDISDSGVVTISSPNLEALDAAVAMINGIVLDPEIGEIYTGKVVKITDFGAFVNFSGRDGLVHISELADRRVEKVTDIVKEGDLVKVKLVGFDKGKIKLSIKAALKELQDID